MYDLKYSLVVSIYNIEKYVSKCIDSIIHQTYKNIEILLIDDGSTDKSKLICDEYALKDDRVKVIHKENAGLGMARNTGLENATGDYILFIDGDDFIDMQLIEVCDKYLKENQYDILAYDFFLYYDDNHIETNGNCKSKLYSKKEIKEIVLPFMIYDIDNSKRIHGSAWNKAYRVNFLKKINFKFVSERKYISEDLYSNLLLYNEVNTFLVISEKLYYYRKNNNNSLTSTYRSDRFEKNNFQYYESIKISKELEYCDIIINNLGFQYLSNMLGAFELILNCSSLSKKEKKKEIYRIIKDKDFNYIVNQLKLTNEPLYKKTLVHSLQHKSVKLSYFMLNIKNKLKRNKK